MYDCTSTRLGDSKVKRCLHFFVSSAGQTPKTITKHLLHFSNFAKAPSRAAEDIIQLSMELCSTPPSVPLRGCPAFCITAFITLQKKKNTLARASASAVLMNPGLFVGPLGVWSQRL